MAYTLDKAKILVVDDMKPMLALTQSVLDIFGFKHIFTATSGEAAFKIVTKEDPDLIITDWIMAPMDGLEFSRLVRRSPMSPNPYVPIMMMTGFSSRFRVEGARDTGITEFLVKPFSSRDLYSRVVQIIERPRQFVEADNFFGPDRRRKLVRDYQGARRRDNDQLEESTRTNADDDQKKIMDIIGKLREEAKNIS
jgi:two-component system chemotaxis response regulator CheY